MPIKAVIYVKNVQLRRSPRIACIRSGRFYVITEKSCAKISCIFLTGFRTYAPYAPCMSMPLSYTLQVWASRNQTCQALWCERVLLA